MINILTYPEDQTTHHVTDWIDYRNESFLIMNANDFYGYQAVELPSHQVMASSNNSFWFRKWRNPGINTEERETCFMQLDTYFNQNKDRFWLNSPVDILKGKGQQLEVAHSCGLAIPDTVITKNREAIANFIQDHNQCIIKFNNVQQKQVDSKSYLSYTQIFNLDKLEQLELTAPCIVQEYIEKEVEIRTFYLNGKCFSMAIFSQNDEQTKIDFRKYNHNRPNRNVPFQLPQTVENKISNCMKALDMNCGSLDLILTPDGKYVFLEVNPLGQFGMVSSPCNYYLEEKVANLLIEASGDNTSDTRGHD